MRYKVTLDDDVIEAIDKALRKAPKKMRVALSTAKKNTERLLNATLKSPQPPPRYPLKWKSERQRRAFFATRGFGHGIPYNRTNRLINAWRVQIVSDDEGGLLEVVNDTPYLDYVASGSSVRQPMFPQWYNYDDVLLKAEKNAQDTIIEAWYNILEE